MAYVYDPEVEAALAYAPRLDVSDVAAARRLIAGLGAGVPPWQPEAGLVYEVHAAPGAPGEPEVDLHLVRPTGDGTLRGALLWFHGGGFVLGDARESLPFLAAVARESGVVAVSVQYRLAPEHPFPAGFEDGHAAWRWLRDHAESMGFEPDRIAIGGQSAGGALAAGLALRIRDQGGSLLYQALDTPVLDDRAETPSATDYVDTPVWNRPNVQASWRSYLGAAETDTPAYAAPARSEDLSGLPPTYITVSQNDPLRDEGIEYARRLAHANVPVDLHLYGGTFHGSVALAPDAEVSRRHDTDLRHALSRAFTRAAADTTTQGA